MLKFRTYRPPDHAPDRHAANGLLLSALAALALHAQRLPFWILLGVCGLVAWRYLIENFGWRHPRRWLRWGLLLSAVVVALNTYGTLLGRDAGVGLLTMLVGLKLLEIRSLRDYYIGVFLIYFVTSASFLFTQSLVAAGLAVAVAVVTTATLVRLSLPSALPAREGIRLSLSILWRALPVMLVMYLLFPRIQGSLWGLPDDAFGARTGLTDRVSPGSIEALAYSDAVAFRASFGDQRPPLPRLYWRSMVLNQTDGSAWYRNPWDDSENGGPWRFLEVGEPTRYSIDYEKSNNRWLVALDLPTSVPAEAVARPGFVIEAKNPVHRRFRYTMRSHLHYRTGSLDPEAYARHLRVPPPTSERVRSLVERWRRESDPVNAVLRYFNEEGFRYSLSPPAVEGDLLDAFLFDTRSGYCEHYAAVFASLMRHIGIPSRVVVGFQGGEWNGVGGYLIVRQMDAHAWSEVWLPGRGWTRIDPTAAVAPERIEFGMNALQALVAEGALPGQLETAAVLALLQRGGLMRNWRRLQLYWDAANTAWNRWVMSYGPERQLRFLQRLGFRSPSWTQLALTLVVGVALVLMVLAAALFWTRSKSDPVAVAYRRLSSKLTDSGLGRRPHEGPLDFYHRVAAARPDLTPELKPIIDLYVNLRYGDVDSADLVARLGKRVRRFKARSAVTPIALAGSAKHGLRSKP